VESPIIDFLGENKGIVLIGTDANLSLLKAIGQRPNPITIIERNPQVVEAAETRVAEINPEVKILRQDYFKTWSADLLRINNQSPGLIVAKHIGLFVDMADLVFHAQDLMPKGGYVVASTPILATAKTLIELGKYKAELKYRRGVEWRTSVFGNSVNTFSSLFIFRIPQLNQVSMEPKAIRTRVFAGG
jgi:hypothetical protein